jgi:hypothetical protein
MPPYCARQWFHDNSETSSCRSTSARSLPSFNRRSPSRNLRTICSGVCRRRFIVVPSIPACWALSSHNRWTTIRGPGQLTSFEPHRGRAQPPRNSISKANPTRRRQAVREQRPWTPPTLRTTPHRHRRLNQAVMRGGVQGQMHHRGHPTPYRMLGLQAHKSICVRVEMVTLTRSSARPPCLGTGPGTGPAPPASPRGPPRRKSARRRE